MTTTQLEQNDLLARAEARALLESDGPPNLIVVFPPYEESERATIGMGSKARTILRDEHESPEQFEARVADELPAHGGFAIMWNE